MSTRRAFLRGAAASIGLPLLPSLSRRAWANPTVPQRVLYFVYPNGCPTDRWSHTGTGTTWTPAPVFDGLASWQSRITLIDGLRGTATPGEPHAQAAKGLLCDHSVVGDNVVFGTSIDQTLAASLGGPTAMASLELTSQGPTLCPDNNGGENSNCPHLWTGSFGPSNVPIPREGNPRRLFERMFGEGTTADPAAREARIARRASVLDAVLTQAQAYRKRLASYDTQRFDAYTTGIFELEQRLYEQEALVAACGPQAEQLRTDPRLYGALDYPDHVELMLDLATLALQCDATRVVSYMMANFRSTLVHTHLGHSSTHHWYSHHEQLTDRMDRCEEVTRFTFDRFAGLLQRLAAVPETQGTLLDATLCLALTPLSDPNSHDDRDLPVVAAGGTNMGLTHGQRHVFTPQSMTRVGRMHLDVAQRMGVPLAQHGAETTPLGVL